MQLTNKEEKYRTAVNFKLVTRLELDTRTQCTCSYILYNNMKSTFIFTNVRNVVTREERCDSNNHIFLVGNLKLQSLLEENWLNLMYFFIIKSRYMFIMYFNINMTVYVFSPILMTFSCLKLNNIIILYMYMYIHVVICVLYMYIHVVTYIIMYMYIYI